MASVPSERIAVGGGCFCPTREVIIILLYLSPPADNQTLRKDYVDADVEEEKEEEEE